MDWTLFGMRSLKLRVTLFTLAIFVASLWSLTFYVSQRLHQDIERELGKQQFSTVATLARQLDQEVVTRQNALRLNAQQITPELMAHPRALQQFLTDKAVFQSLFNGGTFVTAAEGTAIASLPEALGRVGVNYLERDHVYAALKNGQTKVSKPVIGKQLHAPVVSMATPIRNEQGIVIGALVGVIDLSQPNFLDNITDSHYGRSGGYFISSRAHRLIITATDKTRVMETLPAPGISPTLDRFLSGFEGTETFVNPRGVEVLASVKGIASADWYLSVALPVTEAFLPVHNLQRRIFLVAGLLTFLAGAMTWWMLRRELLPILDVAQRLAEMSDHRRELCALPVAGQGEIRDLIGGFNQLIATLIQREAKILSLSNLYAGLRQCNHAIAHCRNEAELFAQICRDVVQFGGMKMAWIGKVSGSQIQSVAAFGMGTEYLQGLEVSLDATLPTGNGPTGICVRENHPVWCQDFQHAVSTEIWHASGSRFGWLASAAIPLLRGGRVVGALNMYAGERDAFTPAIQELLSEMAAEISFALDNFDREVLRVEAEDKLRIHDERLKESQLIAGLGSYVLDFRTGNWESSEGLDVLFGISENFVRNVASWESLIHPDDRAMMMDYLQHEVIAQGLPFNKEYRIVRGNDQVVRWVLGMGRLERDEYGALLSMQGTIQDITERKAVESSLNKLSLAVAQSPNSIVITDLHAHIEYVNAAFTQTSGYTLDELMGKNLSILQSGKTLSSTYQNLWQHLTRGENWQGELLNRRKDGSEYVEFTKISPVRQSNGQITHYLAIKEDLTEKKLAEQRLDTLAHFDQLTGLPNRSLLQDRFKFSLSLAQRNAENLAVMFLDLDHFKNINDTLGHSVGDQLLREIGKRIKRSLREEDTVSRQGGDEFICIMPNTDADGAALVASKLIEIIAQPGVFSQHELAVTASIGIAIYPFDGDNLETLSKNADAAMYRVKQDTRNDFRFFTPEMQAHSARTLQLSLALRHALARNELQLHYQPQLAIQDGHIVGAEALLRWQHPELGMISPAEFIPIAEDSGQIIPIGEWVLRTAARQMKQWLDDGLPTMLVAVNLSAVQFRQRDIAQMITTILDEEQLPHQHLEVELTEAVAMDDPQAVIAVMNRLHALGIRMSIDDFGTGYSSLSYLKKFKVYKLKIDQSFVRNLSENQEDKAIITTIINLASSLGMHTIAEGVETASQLAFLRLQGCDEVQGYYFSKPLPAQQFEAFVRASLVAPAGV